MGENQQLTERASMKGHGWCAKQDAIVRRSELPMDKTAFIIVREIVCRQLDEMLTSFLRLDRRLSKAIYMGNSAVAVRVSELLARSCSGFVWIPVTLALSLVDTGKITVFSREAAAGLLLNLLVGWTIKALLKRERPRFEEGHGIKTDDVVVRADNHSFPSMHAARGMMLAGVASAFLPAPLPYAWALCVGLSRLTLGRHYPSDVCAGFVEGIVESIIVTNVLRPALLTLPIAFSLNF